MNKVNYYFIMTTNNKEWPWALGSCLGSTKCSGNHLVFKLKTLDVMGKLKWLGS